MPICLVRECFRGNCVLHTTHWNGLLLICVFWCCFRYWSITKHFPHKSHLNFFSVKWILLCWFMSDFTLNFLLQISQTKFVFSWCHSRWCPRSHWHLKFLLHNPHEKLFEVAWTAICLFNAVSTPNDFVQMVHAHIFFACTCLICDVRQPLVVNPFVQCPHKWHRSAVCVFRWSLRVLWKPKL